MKAPVRLAPALRVCLVLGVCSVGARAASAADEQPGAAAATPAAPSPQFAVQGRGLYRQFCSNCHGVNMVNAGTSSFDLRKFPREDRERFVAAVTHGKNSMPAWGDILKPEEMEAIWAYVRTGGKS